jgi:hypothetical protein
MKKPLSETQPLSLMISSRCKDTIQYQNKPQSMGVLRSAMKATLERIKLGCKKVFDVWIHEDESNDSGLTNTWDQCMEKSRQADVFIVLYNGRAGWLGANCPLSDGVGICHAELSTAYDRAPSKVRSIQFTELVAAEAGSPDEAFQHYVSELNLSGAQVENGEKALKRCKELAAAIVLSLAREGVGVNSSGSYYAGQALEWSRMNFQTRRDGMTAAVAGLLRKRDARAVEHPDDKVAIVRIQSLDIGFVCDSIPASMSTAAARELVGQPFLKDPQNTKKWNPDLCGPVHVIACQKSVSESQAIRQLGFPDAIVVAAPFGVYVADDVQKIQMAFISNCRDETTTRVRVQAFLNWLTDHGEVKYLVQRAMDRRKISDFIRGLGDAKIASDKVPTPNGAKARAEPDSSR